MARKGFKRKFPPFEILSEEDIEQIKISTLDILKKTGIKIEHKGALKLLEQNDCIVDYDNLRARFPEALVEECIRRCPSSFRVKARDSENDLIFGGNTVYFTSGPGMDIVNLDSHKHRTATEKEYIEGVKVLDALETHDALSPYTPYFGYEGVPEVLKMTMGFIQRLRYSSKFTMVGFAKYNWRFNYRIAKAVDTEIFMSGLSVSSPLLLSKDTVECFFENSEHDFPKGVDTGSIFGATAPATLAGAMALFNAELLASIAIIQLKKPYTRVFVAGFPNAQNMRTGTPNFGNIANTLFNVANNQIWRKYNIPFRNTASIYTNSKKIDYQNGVERGLPAILSAISGASFIHLHGGIYGELTHHPIQAILDDDLAAMVGRFIEGVNVSDETLALNLIHSVGTVPGHFLDKKHTLDWWKKEQYTPKSFDHLTYPEWEQGGKKDCIDYAKERMKKILSEHIISKKLSDEQEEEIKEIVKEAEEFYKKRDDI